MLVSPSHFAEDATLSGVASGWQEQEGYWNTLIVLKCFGSYVDLWFLWNHLNPPSTTSHASQRAKHVAGRRGRLLFLDSWWLKKTCVPWTGMLLWHFGLKRCLYVSVTSESMLQVGFFSSLLYDLLYDFWFQISSIEEFSKIRAKHSKPWHTHVSKEMIRVYEIGTWLIAPWTDAALAAILLGLLMGETPGENKTGCASLFLWASCLPESQLQESAQKGAFDASKSERNNQFEQMTMVSTWLCKVSKPDVSNSDKYWPRIDASISSNIIFFRHNMTWLWSCWMPQCLWTLGILFTPRSYNHTSWQPLNRNDEFMWFIYLEGTPSWHHQPHAISTYLSTKH